MKDRLIIILTILVQILAGIILTLLLIFFKEYILRIYACIGVGAMIGIYGLLFYYWLSVMNK